MLKRSMNLFLLVLSLFSIVVSTNTSAGGAFVIVSAAPPLREMGPPPPGFVTCYTVPAAFYEGVWINPHRVCEYNNRPGGGMWVSGYWQCARYRHMEGVCLDWGWMPGHWANPNVAEYGIHWDAYYRHSGHYGYNGYRNYHHGYSGYHSSGSRWN